LVAGTPKQASGDKRFSLIFMVASSDHLLSKYFSGICSTSQLVNTFRMWGHKVHLAQTCCSCMNMLLHYLGLKHCRFSILADRISTLVSISPSASIVTCPFLHDVESRNSS
jgi:hypothetical protein